MSETLSMTLLLLLEKKKKTTFLKTLLAFLSCNWGKPGTLT